MNILLTTPIIKKNIAKIEAENVKKNGGYFFRTFHFQPKCSIGDKIYFVDDGLIKGYGIIFEISQIKDHIKCSTTGIKYGKVGDWVIKYDNWHWLPIPVQWKGFMGIRYIERIPELADSLKIIESGKFKKRM